MALYWSLAQWLRTSALEHTTCWPPQTQLRSSMWVFPVFVRAQRPQRHFCKTQTFLFVELCGVSSTVTTSSHRPSSSEHEKAARRNSKHLALYTHDVFALVWITELAFFCTVHNVGKPVHDVLSQRPLSELAAPVDDLHCVRSAVYSSTTFRNQTLIPLHKWGHRFTHDIRFKAKTLYSFFGLQTTKARAYEV